MTHDLVTLISEAPAIYLDDIRDWIALVHNVGISITSLHENIQDCGMTYKALHKAAVEQDEEARTCWKEDMQANCGC